jgi:uncharacterized protein YoaH (UPF0181 family)
MIMLANTITGCVALTVLAIEKTGELIIDGIAAGVSAVHNAAEESRYNRASETVIQYDDADSF